MRRVFALFLLFFVGMPFSVYGQDQPVDQVVVYYFHGNFRCPTCMSIEQQTKESIYGNFKSEVDGGKIIIRIVNYDKKENKHFVKDYGLFTKSVVLSLVQDGQEAQFINLQEIWQLVHNKNKFGEYIKTETQKYLDMLPVEEKQP